MSYYRLYLFDGAGSIRHMLEIECAGDAAAVELAHAGEHAGAWELWNRDRMVTRHDPRHMGVASKAGAEAQGAA